MSDERERGAALAMLVYLVLLLAALGLSFVISPVRW
jgi:predicted nucleic acid-binding Zn ribbon protein